MCMLLTVPCHVRNLPCRSQTGALTQIGLLTFLFLPGSLVLPGHEPA